MSHTGRGLRDVFGEVLVEIGREEKRLVVIDTDVAHPTRAHYFAKEFPERFIQMGVAEQNAVSFAAGAAAVGFIPLVNVFASFSTQRALDQISVSVAYPKLNVKITGCYAGLTTPNTGATHQSIEDITIMRAMPNIVVIEPADEVELRQALRKTIIDYKGPVYFRIARCQTPVIFSKDYQFEIGKAVILKEGKEVTLIGSGIMSSCCLEAAQILEKEGISAEVISVSTLKPIDERTILTSAKKTKAVITAENHSIIGGLGGSVAELLSQKLPTRLNMVGIHDAFGQSGRLEDLLVKYCLTPIDVVKAAKNLLKTKHCHVDYVMY